MGRPGRLRVGARSQEPARERGRRRWSAFARAAERVVVMREGTQAVVPASRPPRASSQTRTPARSSRPSLRVADGATMASPRAAIWQIATKNVTIASQAVGRRMMSTECFERLRRGFSRSVSEDADERLNFPRGPSTKICAPPAQGGGRMAPGRRVFCCREPRHGNI
jgi:hypothetical protein